MDGIMEDKILNGKIVAKHIEENVKNRVDAYIEKYGNAPTLVTIMVGDNPASKMYVKMKTNACHRVGINTKQVDLETTTTEEMLELIDVLNNDPAISGILIQHPLPKNVDEQLCFQHISMEKDVDGVNSKSFGAMTMKEQAFGSATPSGIMTILDYYNILLEGKHAVVVGRSPILGKPIAMMLLNKNATVTICHSKTENLESILKTADIVVAACGQPKFIQKEWLKESVVIIDAGYNKGNVGDVDLERASEIASLYTPVPGGVGPVTIATLLEQTMTAAEIMQEKSLDNGQNSTKTLSLKTSVNPQ